MWVIGGGTTFEDVRATHRTGPEVGSERHHGVLGWREVLGLVFHEREIWNVESQYLGVGEG